MPSEASSDEEGSASPSPSPSASSPSPSPPRKKPKSAPKGPSTPNRRLSDVTKTKLASFSMEESTDGGAEAEAGPEGVATADEASWEHLSLAFLRPGRLRDAEMRAEDDADFDPRTLHVPADFLAKCSPGMRQWWQLKSRHFDSILFFKVGKFYELYHMDAVTGVAELGLIFMKGGFAHSGFPEIAYGRMASRLVEKGFKVSSPRGRDRRLGPLRAFSCRRRWSGWSRRRRRTRWRSGRGVCRRRSAWFAVRCARSRRPGPGHCTRVLGT